MRRNPIRDQFGNRLLVPTRDFVLIAGAWITAVNVVLVVALAAR